MASNYKGVMLVGDINNVSTWESEMTPKEWENIMGVPYSHISPEEQQKNREFSEGFKKDYIITTYPTMYRRYLVKDVTSEEEAWDKYYEFGDICPLIDEDYVGDDGDIELELLTPELRIRYGLGDKE